SQTYQKLWKRGKTYSSKSPEAEVSAWVCNPPAPKGGATKRQPLSMECYTVRIQKTFCRVRKTVVCLF
ncbi:hypothetical protein ACIXGC_25305, partial [Bacteroides fragilis]